MFADSPLVCTGCSSRRFARINERFTKEHKDVSFECLDCGRQTDRNLHKRPGIEALCAEVAQ